MATAAPLYPATQPRPRARPLRLPPTPQTAALRVQARRGEAECEPEGGERQALRLFIVYCLLLTSIFSLLIVAGRELGEK